MRALVTGGCGFVGRHLTKRLLSLGYNVTIVDNLYPGSGCIRVDKWLINRNNLQIVYSDCREFLKWNPKAHYDKIFHLAAVVGGRLTIENDPLAVAQDLSIDAEFFRWLSKLDYKAKVYYFSSSAAYPVEFQKYYCRYRLSEIDIDFNSLHIGMPDLTYGWAKLTGEYLAKICHEKYGHNITCFRPFSGYGEDQDLSYPFPSIIKRAINKENPMTVWGSGQQLRDFIYIEDCIDGILHLGEKITDGSAVNLSTGIGTSFNDFAKIAYKIINGEDCEVINTTDKPEGVFARVGDTTLQKELGFEAKTSFEEGIRIAYEFHKQVA